VTRENVDDDNGDGNDNNINNNNNELPLINYTNLIYRFYKSPSKEPTLSHITSGPNP